jgi:hypothetical protein
MKRSTHRIAIGSWRDLRMGPSSFAEGYRAPSTRAGLNSVHLARGR